MWCLALVGVLSIGSVAQAKPVSASLDVTEVTHYMWRGYDILNGAQFPLQPSAAVSLEDIGLSANIWGSYALKDRSTAKSLDEWDLTFGYSRDIAEGIGLSVGGLYYYLNSSTLKTAELCAGFAFSGAMFSPSLTAYYDTKWLDDSTAESDGWYFLASLSHSVPVGGLSLDLGAGLGVGSNASFDGLQDLNLSAKTTLPAGPVSISPFLNAAYIFQRKVNPDSFEIYGGVTISYGF